MNSSGTQNATLIVQSSDGSTISMAYSPFTETVFFYSKVKIGTYIALGFGSTMT